MFTDKKYMSFSDIKLATPLASVKRSENGNSTLIVPDMLVEEMTRFMDLDKIKYYTILNPALCPKEEIKAGMQRYSDIALHLELCDPVLVISPFDRDALFEWSKQLFGDTKDPSLKAYYASINKMGEDCYFNDYEFRP